MIDTPHYKKGQTIFDPETGEYTKIVSIRRLKIWGVERTFYRLDMGASQKPESVWREHHEVMARQPTAADYEI
jgi:hypothetical protein